jgi:hypothetical protein
MRHHDRPIYGTQFHPEAKWDESPAGPTIMRNFMRICGLVPPRQEPHDAPDAGLATASDEA